MQVKKLLILAFFFCSMAANANLPILSPQAKVVMFTCEPGTELYAGFGHSALWVSDPINSVDRLYNWGTFDFNTPNFYTKFIRGKLNYMVSVTSVNRFLNEYQHRKIGVSGQELNLSQLEKQRIFELSETNVLPENRLYQYDFFYDNCATRIRDIVADAVDGEIDFELQETGYTFRQLLFPYLEYSPWTKMGINLILGLASDKKATPFDYMYLPEHMFDQFANASVTTEGVSSPLVKSSARYLDSGLIFQYNILNDPALVFGALLLIIGLITLWEIKSGKYLKWLDVLLNSIGVAAGLFLLFMWIGTDHIATNYNLNIIWLLPAQLLFIASLFVNKGKRTRLVWCSFAIISTASFAMHLWPQPAEISFVIITIIYAFRYLMYKRIASTH